MLNVQSGRHYNEDGFLYEHARLWLLKYLLYRTTDVAYFLVGQMRCHCCDIHFEAEVF